MGKSSTAAKNRYNAKVYDRISVVVAKGKKKLYNDYAESQGLSLNALINKLIEEDMQRKQN